MTDFPVFCQWFLLCEREATKMRWSVALQREVPICDECDAKIEALSTKGPSL